MLSLYPKFSHKRFIFHVQWMFTKKECLCIIKKNSAEINYTIQFARIKSSKIQLRMPFFLHSNLHCECSSLKYSSNLSNMQTRRWRLSVVGVLVAGERNRKRKKLKTDRVTTSSESRGLKRLIFRISFIYSLVKYDLKWWSVCLLILFILS